MCYRLSENQSTKKRTKRRKMLVRADPAELPSIQLTDRDLSILHRVYECRALTTDQIQRRFYPNIHGSSRGPTVRCQQRLTLLFHHGYLFRDEQPVRLHEGRQPLVYFLDKPGAQVLASYLNVEMAELDWHPRHNAAGAGHLFLTHLLKSNDVRLAVEMAAFQHPYRLDRWLDERMLRRAQMKDYVELTDQGGRREKVAVVPDGYFVLRGEASAFYHFLEIDLRTTIGLSSRSGHRDWARRVQAYVAYHRSGQYQERYGAESFRVLTVTTGEQRLANLKAITEQAGGKTRFWFTTFDLLASQTVLTEAIWQVAGRSESLALLF